ncbi:MAG: hypothetical protein HKN47_11975 [Pirellulaceae bacterium]|nr:hypothetical protein [Pirellulaceae bacterium]
MAKRPNIMLVYADGIGARELPIYGSSAWSKLTRRDTSDNGLRATTPIYKKMAAASEKHHAVLEQTQSAAKINLKPDEWRTAPALLCS